MRPVLERDPHGERLALLVQRWQREEAALLATLAELQTAHERSLREANWQRLIGEQPSQALLRHCELLAGECEATATELLHLRLALQGAAAEARMRPSDPTAFAARWRDRTSTAAADREPCIL